MDIDFIIPAKTSSERVPNKNWRPFHKHHSLVDLVIAKLLAAGAPPDRIHVSCEDAAIAWPVCERWGVNLIPRTRDLCDNEVPLTDWVRGITCGVPGDSDVAWCQVCDPLFDEYAECLDKWKTIDRAKHDSLVVCYPWRGYLMSESCQPIGWSFGEHHTPSQRLPEFRTMPFTFSLLTRKAIERTGYHVGARPLWHLSRGPHVDIDTKADFEMARIRWSQVSPS